MSQCKCVSCLQWPIPIACHENKEGVTLSFRRSLGVQTVMRPLRPLPRAVAGSVGFPQPQPRGKQHWQKMPGGQVCFLSQAQKAPGQDVRGGGHPWRTCWAGRWGVPGGAGGSKVTCPTGFYSQPQPCFGCRHLGVDRPGSCPHTADTP